MKKTLAALAATAACLAFAGCSEDDEGPDRAADDSSQVPALTKAELIEQGDAICKAGDDEIEAADSRFVDRENPTQEEFVSAVAEVVVPSLESQAAQLRELVPPAEDAETIETMLDTLEAATAQVKADPLAITQEDLFGDANRLASDYGFTECGDAE